MILSICIPTYNRLPYLRELIGVLEPQISKMNSDDVELVVSDNSSTDGTSTYLASLDIPNFRFWTNEANVGGDRNFLKCVAEARGGYVWLFGDDDIMPDGIIGKVVDFLRENRPSLLISGNDDVPCMLYNDYCAMVKEIGDNIVLSHTLISANVFKRELFDVSLAEKTLWVQYAHMFGMMANMTNRKVGVMPNIVNTRPARACFAKYPSCLCVKQAVYLWWLADRFGMSCFYWRAVRNACNLPVEYASRIWNWGKGKICHV